MESVLHYPRLDTILMVEKIIREHSGAYKKKQLWERLPRKMMYQTYCVIVNYLQDSGKIAMDRQQHICWVWDPEGVARYLNRPDLTWQPSSSLLTRVSRSHSKRSLMVRARKRH